MTLNLGREPADQIRAHARRTYPEECIGILGGHVDDASRTVTEVCELTNAFPGPRHNRSLIAPADYLRLERDLTARGLTLIGFYHSHPDHPARPSEFDRDNALPWHSYVIVRVAGGDPVELTAWRLAEDRSGFIPEPLGDPSPSIATFAQGA